MVRRVRLTNRRATSLGCTENPWGIRNGSTKFGHNPPVRLRITHAMRGDIDGIPLDSYEVGAVYEVSTELGSYLLAARTAEPADGETPLRETLAARHRLFGDRLRGWHATASPAAIVDFPSRLRASRRRK